MGVEYEICVTSRLSNLSEIAEFVSDRAALTGLDERQVFEVQMATDEACTNSMEHAYEGREDGEVRVCCYLEGDCFVVRITDFGRPFDPDSVPKPDLQSPLEERQIGGLGIFLMRELMDSVEFHSDPIAGNQVIMRKQRRKAATA
ncbi:MAG: ATP-binding protein [Chloroflexi bacterium]|jgi:anti-sigma regulatory factor (Ser/Thr protein kinase)|nr:ATP-binding protein [Chloroflexota bacterium]